MLCKDCLENEATMSCKKINDGLCERCRRRKGAMKHNYIPIKDAEEIKRARKVKIENIKSEVIEVLENCYTEHNCNIKSEIHIDDILMSLNILRELFLNNKELITEIKNKLDIIERYRRDINHESELEDIENNDELAIYISRKEHILNNIRRELKDKLEIYETVEPLIKTIKSDKQLNIEQISSVINKVTTKIKTQNCNKRSYIPYVDHSMIDKYEWCNKNGQKYVTKKKLANYEVTALKTNLSKKIFNEEIKIMITAYSEDEAITHAKRKLGMDKLLIKTHNIFSNFNAKRCN